MSLSIETIVNNPLTSNCHIVYDDEKKECIVIDPGSEYTKKIEEFIYKQALSVAFILLTHEHFDHCWGVNRLRELYPKAKLVCSDICSDYIQKKKKNMSLFYNNVGFEVKAADIEVKEQEYKLTWNRYNIEIMKTLGHSLGSVCIYIKEINALFSGDVLIYGEKTVTKLIGGNKNQLNETINLLKEKFANLNSLVYSGHGVTTHFSEYFQENNI